MRQRISFLEGQEAIEAPYKPGDFIGTKYEVGGVLGKGGFGVVYLVYDHEIKDVYALKTFRDEDLGDDRIRELFRKEAQTWVNLERHAYLVRAYFVDEISNRLYIAMEYIAPDEQERNTLQDYLNDPYNRPDLAQSLKWAIQFCHGMEYAYSRGIKCHRDIKPDNIMISDNTVKISDFGLAAVAKETGVVCGTPGYMAPEVELRGEADKRSDIYSFGVVLYQMAAGSADPPSRGWLGRIPSVNGPMKAIIETCLQNKPENRYPTFDVLRNDLESLLKEKTGEAVRLPEKIELEAGELSNKGVSLHSLGHFDEAIFCYNKALEINPRSAEAYNNRGVAYAGKGKHDRAITDYNKALEINPRSAEAYNNRGLAYGNKGDYDRAIADFNKSLEISQRDVKAYNNRGNAYADKGDYDRAIADYNKALEINPRDAESYYNRGLAYDDKGDYDRAIADYTETIKINPSYADAYFNRGLAYAEKGDYDCAIADYDKALEINPRCADAYNNRAVAYFFKKEYDKAWEDVHKAQGLGYQVHPGFLDALRQATGREI